MMKYTIDSLETYELKDLRNVNLISKNGYIDEYEARSFIFPNNVRVVSIDTLNFLLAKLIEERNNEIEKNKQFTRIELESQNLKSKNQLLKDEIEALKKNLKEYDNTYGKYVSPFTIIDELYRGIKLPYMVLIKRQQFKIKISPKQFNYWVGVFIDLEIVRKIDKGKLQSIRSYEDGHDILYQNNYVWKGRDEKDK